MRTLGAEVSHKLAAHSVRHIFGVPGVHNLELYRGLPDLDITHILARHEQGAGFMADGYARASGRPGIVYVISGPGLCNVMTPMGQAYSDSVPMLVVSSGLPKSQTRQSMLHQMRDQRGAGASVCDWSEIGEDAHAVSSLIERAFREFEFERPRPKHLQIPLDMLSEMVEPMPISEELSEPSHPRFDLSSLISDIRQSSRVLFIIGGGAKGAKLEELAARIEAASFETYAGKAIISFMAERNYGSYLARPSSAQEIAKSDLVVVFGSELSEVDLWREDLGATAPIYVIDRWPEGHPLEGRAEFIIGDCVDVTEALLHALAPQKSTWEPRDIARTKEKFRLETDRERPGIMPIAEALAEALPPEVWLVSDMTQFAYCAKEVFAQKRAGHWLHPYGFGTLGYALPAAIGAKIARPEEPVLCIAGDYGFQYSLNELGTAAEHNLAIPILLWDNSELKEITASMHAIQMQPTETTIRNPDFKFLSKAYGAEYQAPENITSLCNAIEKAFEGDGPTLIRVTPEIAMV